MGYENRQHELKIKFPDGKEYSPLFKNYEQSYNHFIESKNGVGKKSTNINDIGVSLRRIPLIIEFAGKDHDIEANDFEASAAYTGAVFIQPPYGKEIRCHTSTVKRSYSLINDVAATRFDIEFLECTGKGTPLGGRSQLAAILEKVNSVNDNASSTFFGLKINNQKELTGITGVFEAGVNAVNKFLRPMIEGQAEAIAIFDATYNSITNNITEIVTAPVTLARQTATLINLPAKFVKKTSIIFEGYKKLIASVLPAPASVEKNNDGRNQAINAGFFGGAAVAAISGGAVAADYETTKESIESIEQLQEIYDDYREQVDNLQDAFNDPDIPIIDRFIQDGILDVPLNELVQDTAGSILSIAFDLKKEIIIVLEQETTAINIAIKYYPDRFIEDEITTLDFVINSNNLIGDELILIPRGREIIVYV